MTSAGRVLRALRHAALLTLEDAAVATGLSPTRLRDIERGTSETTYMEGFALAPVYLLSPADLSKHLRRAYAHDLSIAGDEPEEATDAA